MVLNPQPLPQNSGQSTVQGRQLQAGKDVTLHANRDVDLLSAENTQYLVETDSLTGDQSDRPALSGRLQQRRRAV
ncbi:hemagglutinin repeat-containing protein [Serratia liquefaciens]|uniref:hemagglutinin repeat-containing protein n=1 Tax=Serratia liquefaciens TaxID=614 RepID=UPI001F11CA62|nr:hemagglutinin repeat-containing protein [Serratia liquefaciens]